MGTTAGGLPYPDDNAPAADGAMAIKDLATALDQPHRGRATQTVAQQIPTGSATVKVTSLLADYAEGVVFGNNEFTIVRPGLYVVTLQLSFAANATGVRSVRCLRNGILVNSAFAQVQASSTTQHMLHTTEVEFAAGDLVSFAAVQTSGATVATVAAYTSLAIRQVAGPVAG